MKIHISFPRTFPIKYSEFLSTKALSYDPGEKYILQVCHEQRFINTQGVGKCPNNLEHLRSDVRLPCF